uniref:Glycoprotein n=1 Tax=Perinereis aibuhitensis bunya-like virus TaxID=3237973 RepID=A0AB39A390_9VIRU
MQLLLVSLVMASAFNTTRVEGFVYPEVIWDAPISGLSDRFKSRFYGVFDEYLYVNDPDHTLTPDGVKVIKFEELKQVGYNPTNITCTYPFTWDSSGTWVGWLTGAILKSGSVSVTLSDYCILDIFPSILPVTENGTDFAAGYLGFTCTYTSPLTVSEFTCSYRRQKLTFKVARNPCLDGMPLKEQCYRPLKAGESSSHPDVVKAIGMFVSGWGGWPNYIRVVEPIHKSDAAAAAVGIGPISLVGLTQPTCAQPPHCMVGYRLSDNYRKCVVNGVMPAPCVSYKGEFMELKGLSKTSWTVRSQGGHLVQWHSRSPDAKFCLWSMRQSSNTESMDPSMCVFCAYNPGTLSEIRVVDAHVSKPLSCKHVLRNNKHPWRLELSDVHYDEIIWETEQTKHVHMCKRTSCFIEVEPCNECKLTCNMNTEILKPQRDRPAECLTKKESFMSMDITPMVCLGWHRSQTIHTILYLTFFGWLMVPLLLSLMMFTIQLGFTVFYRAKSAWKSGLKGLKENLIEEDPSCPVCNCLVGSPQHWKLHQEFCLVNMCPKCQKGIPAGVECEDHVSSCPVPYKVTDGCSSKSEILARLKMREMLIFRAGHKSFWRIKIYAFSELIALVICLILIMATNYKLATEYNTRIANIDPNFSFKPINVNSPQSILVSSLESGADSAKMKDIDSNLARKYFQKPALESVLKMSNEVKSISVTSEGEDGTGNIKVSTTLNFNVPLSSELVLARKIKAEGATPSMLRLIMLGSVDVLKTVYRGTATDWKESVTDKFACWDTCNVVRNDTVFNNPDGNCNTVFELNKMSDWGCNPGSCPSVFNGCFRSVFSVVPKLEKSAALWDIMGSETYGYFCIQMAEDPFECWLVKRDGVVDTSYGRIKFSGIENADSGLVGRTMVMPIQSSLSVEKIYFAPKLCTPGSCHLGEMADLRYTSHTKPAFMCPILGVKAERLCKFAHTPQSSWGPVPKSGWENLEHLLQSSKSLSNEDTGLDTVAFDMAGLPLPPRAVRHLSRGSAELEFEFAGRLEAQPDLPGELEECEIIAANGHYSSDAGVKATVQFRLKGDSSRSYAVSAIGNSIAVMHEEIWQTPPGLYKKVITAIVPTDTTSLYVTLRVEGSDASCKARMDEVKLQAPDLKYTQSDHFTLHHDISPDNAGSGFSRAMRAFSLFFKTHWWQTVLVVIFLIALGVLIFCCCTRMNLGSMVNLRPRLSRMEMLSVKND